MSTYSHRMGSFRHRDVINLTPSVNTKRQQYLWICSQIHSKVVFLVVQILMILLSLVILIVNIDKAPSHEHNWGQFFIAYALFFGAITGVWALKLVDNMYRRGNRMKKHCIISPKLIIIPSYIVQIGFIIFFAYETFHYLITHMSSFMERSSLFLFFGVLIPIWLTWLMILYVFAAEINCFIYIINRYRHWRLAQYPPSLLNIRTLNNERRPFESSPSRNRLLSMLNERVRTKSSESIATVDSGSRNACNNMETRIEVIPPMHATDNMAPFFSECSRRGISMISSQLDTVPEESSKSLNSLP